MNSVLVIAAESSAAQYALDIMNHIPETKFFGVGDRAMTANGFDAVAPAEELAVVGIQEVFSQYTRIRKAFFDVLKKVDEEKPQVALLIDYPGFNIRLCKELHERNIPIIYYVSPQIWAWKKNRVHKIKKYVSKMLVLFPFEEDLYKEYDVPVEFVGHPMIDQNQPELLEPENRDLHRQRFGIKPHDLLVGFMPGSRHKEIEKNLPVQIEVARRLFKKHNQMRFVFMVAPTLEKEDLLKYLEGVGFPYMLLKDEPLKMIALTDAILAASGTATLQVAMMRRPMVIMYRVNWLTAFLGKRLAQVKYIGLVNVILNREAIPERILEQSHPDVLTPKMEEVIFSEPERQRQQSEYEKLFGILTGGATKHVVRHLRSYLDAKDASV